MTLLKRAIELRDDRNSGFMEEALKQFHGHNGITYYDLKLFKNGDLIAEAKLVKAGLYSITIFRNGKPWSSVTDSQDSFNKYLVEGMSNHV